MHLLGCGSLIHETENRNFLMQTQNSFGGGFAKWVDVLADPLHTYMGVSALALMHTHERGLREVHPGVGST